MKAIGSQIREKIEDTSYEICLVYKKTAILMDMETGNTEIWAKNDHFAAYVIEINGVGYEFVREE
jgi:hypothetical protein